MHFFKHFLHKKTEESALSCSMIVVAAGKATRMEGMDKILMPLQQVPVLLYSLRLLQDVQQVSEIVVVTREDCLVEVARLCKQAGLSKVTQVLPGGETRTASVLVGLDAVETCADLIGIHDGARPFLTQELVTDVIACATETGAAAPAIPVKDTIKVARHGVVQTTPDRDTLYAVQTPQVFESSLIKAAIVKAMQDQVILTDDCAAVERLGMTVQLTEGSQDNIKLTTPDDVFLGEALLMKRGMK